MPVIINDIDGTNGSTNTVDIPTGQHDHMLVAITSSWRNAATPARGAPSGGGGSWTLVDDQEVNWYYISSLDYRLRTYVWYSYPTSRGAVSITNGTETGDFDHSVVFSLSNAVYNSVRSISEIQTIEIADYSAFGKQGSTLFGVSIGVVRDLTFFTQAMYDAVIVEAEVHTYAEFSPEEPGEYGIGYVAPYYARERGQRLTGSPYQRYVRGGADWNTGSPGAYSANIQIAVDSIECTI